MKTTTFTLLTTLLLAALHAADAESSRPNFIVIMVDDMGYAGVSCFGNPYFKTPNIDRLAAEGMRLTDFHSSGTVCSPTRAGLLTGRYQQRAGIEAVIHPAGNHVEHRKGLQKCEVTFAELLKNAGYATGLIGKWHQGYVHNSDDYHPQNHGFDEFIGYHSGNIDFISHVGDHVKHDWWHGRAETKEAGYVTDLINRYALEFIDRHKQRPFCLYIPHLSIHNPVQVRDDPVRRSEKEGWKRWKPSSDEERIEKYRGMVLPIDEGVGQIREQLISRGLDKNTLVLFFSDNGASAEFPSGSLQWRGNKGSVYEGGHKVPFIAWWPGRVAPGTSSDAPAITLDVMPTLLSLAGVKSAANRPLDGVDLSTLLLECKVPIARPLFWASLSNNGARNEAMRDGPWKLVVNHPKAKPGTFDNEQVELYRLDRDPSETNDLANSEPVQTQSMLTRLKHWYADTQGTATPQPGGWLAPAALHAVDPASPVMLRGDWVPDDHHQIDYAKLPRVPSEHAVVNSVKERNGVNQHNYLIHHAGRYWVMWSDGPGIEDRVGQRVKFANSPDGLKWSEPEYLTPIPPDSAPDSPHYNTRTEKGFRYISRGFWLRDGQLLALAALDEAAGFFGKSLSLHAFRLTADGASWEEAGVIADNTINNFPPAKIPSGEWMMSRRSFDYKTKGVDFLVGGVTSVSDWLSFPVLGTSSELKAEEPLWWTLPDGRLAALFRDNGNSKFLYRSCSTDNGRTWTPPVRTDFPDSRSKLHGLRLSDGRYVLVSNSNPRARDPLTLALSDDGVVFNQLGYLVGGRHVDYPHVLEHDGHLLVAFAGGKQSVEVLKIKLTALDQITMPASVAMAKPLPPVKKSVKP